MKSFAKPIMDGIVADAPKSKVLRKTRQAKKLKKTIEPYVLRRPKTQDKHG